MFSQYRCLLFFIKSICRNLRFFFIYHYPGFFYFSVNRRIGNDVRDIKTIHFSSEEILQFIDERKK